MFVAYSTSKDTLQLDGQNITLFHYFRCGVCDSKIMHYTCNLTFYKIEVVSGEGKTVKYVDDLMVMGKIEDQLQKNKDEKDKGGQRIWCENKYR